MKKTRRAFVFLLSFRYRYCMTKKTLHIIIQTSQWWASSCPQYETKLRLKKILPRIYNIFHGLYVYTTTGENDSDGYHTRYLYSHESWRQSWRSPDRKDDSKIFSSDLHVNYRTCSWSHISSTIIKYKKNYNNEKITFYGNERSFES